MKNPNPLPHAHSYHEQGAGANWVGPMIWPRRACTDQHTPAEQAIRNASVKVEELGADLLLTHAVMKLQEAQALVADWLEGKVGELSADGTLVTIEGSAAPSGVEALGPYWKGERITTTSRLVEIVKAECGKAWDGGHAAGVDAPAKARTE